jgi:hypothetical protein
MLLCRPTRREPLLAAAPPPSKSPPLLLMALLLLLPPPLLLLLLLLLSVLFACCLEVQGGGRRGFGDRGFVWGRLWGDGGRSRPCFSLARAKSPCMDGPEAPCLHGALT